MVPSIAGPKRPQDRVALSDAKAAFRKALADYVERRRCRPSTELDEAVEESFPASDPARRRHGDDDVELRTQPSRGRRLRRPAEQAGRR